MPVLPSWIVHKKWCLRVCGKYYREIDELIDASGKHDLGARNPKVFLEQISYIREKYGDPGTCCYLLHHILDEIRNQLVVFKTINFSNEEFINMLLRDKCKLVEPFSIKLLMDKTIPNSEKLKYIMNNLNKIMVSICNPNTLEEIINNILYDARITKAIHIAKINTIIGELVNKIEYELNNYLLNKYKHDIEKYIELRNEIRYRLLG